MLVQRSTRFLNAARSLSKAATAGVSRSVCSSSFRVAPAVSSRNLNHVHPLWQNQATKVFKNSRFFSSLPNHTALSMPALSPTMTQGNIAKWMIKPGQKIAPGDQLCDLETDKATIAWEAQDEGFVAAILVPEGSSDIPVGQVVLVICDNEADVPAFATYKAAAAPAASAPAASAAAAATPPPPPPPPPSAPKTAASPAPPAATTAASGAGLLKQMQQRQWAFSKQYGLPTPQHMYV